VDEPYEEVTRQFEDRLNEHGYGFTYAVLETIKKNPHGWKLKATEFPVEVRGKSTRIDFILRHWKANVFIVAECKRANPRTAKWCFAKATTASQLNDDYLRKFVLEDIRQAEKGGPHYRTAMDAWTTDQLHHIACEVKTGDTGTSGGKNVDEIEGAVTQVLRGMNGLADWFVANPAAVPSRAEGMKPIGLMPVVFTTANLFSSSVDLSTTDLQTGRVAVRGEDLHEVNWLHYQYYQAPSLLSTVRPAHENKNLVDALHNDFTRTVAFVSPDGISEFLTQTSELIANPFHSERW